MEIAASVEGRPRRREHRSGGGRFRAEIETNWGSPSIPRGPGYGFAAAVREPLVRLQRPKFDFEIWDWDYFAWPHDRLDANLEMRDSDPDATLEADRKASDSFLNQSTLLLESYAMEQDTQEQHAAAWSSEQLDGANLDMRDSDPEATLGADRKASDGFLNWSTLQLEGYALDQYTQEQNAITLPCNQHNANQGSRECNWKGTLEADQKARESLLSRSTLQLKRREMHQDQQTQASESLLGRSTLQLKRREMHQDQHTQEQQKEPELQISVLLDDKPVGRRSTRRRRGCAEANGILDHGRAMQGSWAC